MVALPLAITFRSYKQAGIFTTEPPTKNCTSNIRFPASQAPPRLQWVYGSEFVTRHPISIKILIIHFVPALHSEDLF